MEQLTQMVIGITAIIVLASLLEMLLPDSGINKFVEAVVGLFVLVTVLNPMVKFLKSDWSQSLQGFFENETVNMAAIEKGQKIADQQRQMAATNYSDKLEQQISAVGSLLEGVEVRDVEVTMDTGAGVPGNLQQITLRVKGDNAEGIDRVDVDLGGKEEDPIQQALKSKAKLSQEQREKLVSTLANFYGLNPENIRIEEDF